MKKITAVLAAALFVSSASIAMAGGAEDIFNKNCKACHPNGGNIANPKKTLKTDSLAANGIKTADDIVKYLRAPVKPMPAFGADKISDADAKALAEYVLATFNK